MYNLSQSRRRNMYKSVLTYSNPISFKCHGVKVYGAVIAKKKDRKRSENGDSATELCTSVYLYSTTTQLSSQSTVISMWFLFNVPK